MQGLLYPLEIANGTLKTTEDYPTLVSRAILSALKTKLEERVFRPDYGRDVSEFQSVNNLVDVLGGLRQAIALGLEGYAGVSFELYGSISDNGLVEVQVLYTCDDDIERTLEIAL